MEYTHIEPIRKLLARCSQVYIVGGTVRDHLLGLKCTDIDVVIDRDPKEVLEGRFFPLDQERGIYRLLYEELTVDVSRMQGETITEDLKRRDYTINAIGYNPKEGRLIDPTGGIEDLKSGILRMVSEVNLQRDPVRLMRGVRLWLHLPVRLHRETVRAMARNAHLVRLSAPERIKEELSKVVSHPLSFKAVQLMKRTGLLQEIFAPLKKCTGLFQGKFYGCDLLEHLVYCYGCAERLTSFVHHFMPYEEVKEALDKETEKGIKKKHLLKIAALLHDVGKPQTFKIRDDEYTFWGHDREGASMAKEAMEALRFSSKSSETVARLVENHMRLHLLARAGEITPKAKGRFFRKLGEDGVLTVLLSLADSLSSSGDLGFFYLMPYAEEMVEFYREMLKESKLQRPLLSGYEVMEILGIEPSPLVGKVLNHLLEAQTEGIIKSKEEAIKFVREVYGDGGDSVHQGTYMGQNRG